jgi:hypothetical protein
MGHNVQSVNAAISLSSAPKEIVKACINQIMSQTQKKDKELRDLLKVILLYD